MATGTVKVFVMGLLFVNVWRLDARFVSVCLEILAKYELYEGEVDSWRTVARGNFTENTNQTGWSYLEITTNEAWSDNAQAYAAGYLEGVVTRDLIKMHWMNTVDGYCTPNESSSYCQRLKKYITANLDWVNSVINNSYEDPYWHQVKLFFHQLQGLEDGYFNRTGGYSLSDDIRVSPFGLLLFQISGDFEDLEVALHKSDNLKRVLGSGSCSALIKLLDHLRDLYVSHDTWSTYQSMLRILKKYDFGYHLSPKFIGKNEEVPGRTMTFSSYPGVLMSGDDYYLVSSGLAVLETTIGNSNPALYVKYISPLATVFEGIRNMVANRLADSGNSWVKLFSQWNSGTYNNQWMVIDYKKFTPGETPSSDLLWVLEQLPGMVKYEDMTSLLVSQTYWPSYNSPYFQEIFDSSGLPDMVKKYGDWFSYDKTPRANIFRRDHGKVTDLDSMTKLMRYNDFKNDPLSRCNCTPPYSAENAISARCDLNPMNGTYPFGALGHRQHGGTDMKLTNYTMFQSLEFRAVSGPSFHQQPPFQWSKSDFNHISHQGHPDKFMFQPIQHSWNLTHSFPIG